ncbi:alpha/beta hydrolase [Clostridium sp. AWRP]|nr:alpha/beta hydrolase [Clostridium sp. AWRP]
MRRMMCIILIIFSILLICIFICVGVLIVHSSGKPKPFLDKNGKPLPGSISEKIHVNIGGVEQGMFIKGKNKTKPVLLFIHGGPGMPEYAISQKYAVVLENYFTVCWWDQRGAGLSYNSNISKDTMTEDQLISDTIEVTNYLRNRFGQKKIYLMAHSWGTYIGIQSAAKAPELYNGYIAMSQMSKQLESEKLSYEYIVEQYKIEGNKRMLEKLENSPIDKKTNLPIAYWSMRDKMMHSLGVGTTHKMKSVVTGIFLPVMESPEYTFSEKINIWRGKYFSGKTKLEDTEYTTDLTKKVKKLDIPVYFCDGIYDYTVSYKLAKDYFDKLQAPKKRFYTFNQSAHSPLFEEPEKFARILQEDVLKK